MDCKELLSEAIVTKFLSPVGSTQFDDLLVLLVRPSMRVIMEALHFGALGTEL